MLSFMILWGEEHGFLGSFSSNKGIFDELFRDSKLTMLLRESLGNINCRTTMIAHISDSPASFTESLSTVQIASRIHRMRKKKSKAGSLINLLFMIGFFCLFRCYVHMLVYLLLRCRLMGKALKLCRSPHDL